jgi:hypothetical protein
VHALHKLFTASRAHLVSLHPRSWSTFSWPHVTIVPHTNISAGVRVNLYTRKKSRVGKSTAHTAGECNRKQTNCQSLRLFRAACIACGIDCARFVMGSSNKPAKETGVYKLFTNCRGPFDRAGRRVFAPC